MNIIIEDGYIPNGYILWPRYHENSEITDCCPCAREIYKWLTVNAQYAEIDIKGSTIRRGQLLCTINQIIEALSWRVGYRKKSYTKDQVSNALKRLRELGVIETVKTTRGMIITICNYDEYQTPENYERSDKRRTRSAMKTQRTDSRASTINKKEERIKEPTNNKKKDFFPADVEENKPEKEPVFPFQYADWIKSAYPNLDPEDQWKRYCLYLKLMRQKHSLETFQAWCNRSNDPTLIDKKYSKNSKHPNQALERFAEGMARADDIND